MNGRIAFLAITHDQNMHNYRYIYTVVHIQIHTYACVHTHTYKHLYMCTHIYIHTLMHVRAYTHMQLYHITNPLISFLRKYTKKERGVMCAGSVVAMAALGYYSYS